MTADSSANPLPSIVAPGPPTFRSVLFENRDLMGVSLLELNQYGFDTLEVSQDLLEETPLNCFRCEASRWHTAGSNHEGKLHALKHMTLELSSQEVGGVDPSTLFPATVPEGLNEYSGRSLVELRSEVQEMEQKLVLYKAAAKVYAWAFFEKLLQLSNAEVDRSTEDSPADVVPPTQEVKMEALLDTLVWATHRFGGVSKALTQISESATRICDSASSLGPTMTEQTHTVAKLSEGLLALTAHVKVNGDNAGPMLAGIKALQKQMENCSWQISGSGAKLVNVSVKELLMSQGKNIGENTANTAKSLEILKHMYEGLVALNDSYKEGTSTMKESNNLLKELIEGQKMALRQPGLRMAQQTSTLEPIPPAPVTMGTPGTASVPAPVTMGTPGTASVPAAFQAAPPNLTRIPGTILPRPPLWPVSHSEGTPSTPPEEVDPVAPGFKRVKLADGSVMTMPKGWQSDPNL